MGFTALLADARSNPFGFAQELNGTENARISLLLSCHFNTTRSPNSKSDAGADAGSARGRGRGRGTTTVTVSIYKEL